MLQLSQQVLIESVELWEVVQDLFQETLLDHWLPGLTGSTGHGATEVLQHEHGGNVFQSINVEVKKIK